MTSTYTIEQRDERGHWTSEGVGESKGWPDLSGAIDALRSLADLGEEWAGEYRITRDGVSVHRETIGEAP